MIIFEILFPGRRILLERINLKVKRKGKKNLGEFFINIFSMEKPC